jgi:hypothetical protein
MDNATRTHILKTVAKIYILKQTIKGQFQLIEDRTNYDLKKSVIDSIKSVDKFINLIKKLLKPDDNEIALDDSDLLAQVIDKMINATENGTLSEFKKKLEIFDEIKI